jgi:hypothetical protein
VRALKSKNQKEKPTQLSTLDHCLLKNFSGGKREGKLKNFSQQEAREMEN